MKVSDFLLLAKEDVSKVVAWVRAQEPKVLSDVQLAVSLSTKAIAWATGPQGIAVEQFIASEMPQALSWEATALKVLTDLLADMLTVKSTASIESIAERFGAEIWNILDGGKKPTGLSGYISEFQDLFVPATK